MEMLSLSESYKGAQETTSFDDQVQRGENKKWTEFIKLYNLWLNNFIVSFWKWKTK